MVAALRSVFAKPVDRPIDGVIKADDEASLRIELDEYVITNEIGQCLDRFLGAYNNYDTANGVWISGFFGSGKSHLLKMLALLMENRETGGEKAFDIFAEKLGDNPMLAGALRKAVSIPSKSILFNIDQKADVISKTAVDALLSVFQKVFDEACGYYGKLPHIAQFERDLDEREQFSAFKAAFEAAAGKPWERGREQATLETRNIATAFAKAAGGDPADAKDILGQYRIDTNVSIEDFANSVKAWIDKQGPMFRLNFFVDEVGQYIAENVKLMTNLQTIAESLNTKCKGQAWVIVTSQQDMEAIIGDGKAFQSQDFSKIMARFEVKMPLNSADVAEVIQRRLLSKTDEGQITLGHLHDREENNLKTLFDFGDGSIKLKNFEGRDNFIASYPFPPYQYVLFQMAITSLSQHNAFEGKHSSVGERSMLGVFQEVSKILADQPIGGLATFDLMFEGIRTALKSAVQQSIQIAEKGIQDIDPFAVRVLKALFLVKYVKEFRPTVRNISVLLLSELDTDQAKQRRKIEEALSYLERNTLIQRNGEVYEFLTNEEKDVEAEIKGLDVDPSELSKEMETLAFDTILRHRKIKHLTTGNEYSFSRKLDDHLLGREYELVINVISPFNDDVASPEVVRMRNMSREELAVLLPHDVRFIRDLTLFKQTDKFVRQARGGAAQPSRDRILAEKGEQNARRIKDLELRLRKHLTEARLFVRGDEINIGGDDAQERLVKGFQALIDKVYVNLPMLRSETYAEADITKAASPDSALLGADDGGGMSEVELEVLNYIQGQARNGIKVPTKYLVERFGEKPYGWPTTATLCLAASLSGKGRVEARSDAAVLERDDLAKALRNSHMLANILLTPQTEYTPAQLRKAKDLYRELFGKPAESADARSLGAEWAEAVRELSNELDKLMNRDRDYPFLSVLAPLAADIEAMRDKPVGWYMTEPAKQENALLNAKEDVLDKIRSFMAGGQKSIYDEAREFLHDQEGNLGYTDPSSVDCVREVLKALDCYKGAVIQNLKTDLYRLKEALELQLLDERKAARDAIEGCRFKLEALDDFQALSDAQRDVIRSQIDHMASRINATPLIPVLRDLGSSVRTTLLPELLVEIERMKRPAGPPPSRPGGVEEAPTAPPKPAAMVDVRQVKVSFAKPWLADESDVEAYVEEMKKSLLAEIRAGKRVIV
tara:strand:- start:24091 stop:27621 length:3531 start_codon:yes stop_codon:yes gene_type:complete